MPHAGERQPPGFDLNIFLLLFKSDLGARQESVLFFYHTYLFQCVTVSTLTLVD